MGFDPEVHAAMNGQPEEPTPYYTWTSYINPDFANCFEGEEDPGTILLGQCGVRIGSMVISVVNGTLCANPIDEPPISMNFEQYMIGYLESHITSHDDVEVVWFDTQTERYKPGDGPPIIRFIKKED